MRTRKVLLTLLVIVFTFVCCSCVKTDNNIENYADDIERYHADLFMPLLEDVGEYKEANYFIRKDETVFPEYAMQLVVKYDKDVYLKEKERLKTAYTYLDKAQKADWDENVYAIPATEFFYAGFSFKVATFEDTVYPKNFGMVGVSDEKFAIAYLWVYAQDLDSICEVGNNGLEEMQEFVECHFALEV